MRAAVEHVGDAFAAAGARVERDASLLPDLQQQHEDYIRMLLAAMSRGRPAAGPPMTPERWAAMFAAQRHCIAGWMAAFEQVDAVIAPCWGTTAFGHDDTLMETRLLSIDGEATPFGLQLAWPGLATFPNLPATSVPVGIDADGLPIGLQVIAAPYCDHTAIAVAKAAHDLVWS